MGGNNIEGDHSLAEKAAEGAIAGGMAAGLRVAFEPGFKNAKLESSVGAHKDAHSLPPFELEKTKMGEDAKEAAGKLLKHEPDAKAFAQAELKHASVVDRQFHQEGKFYAKALDALKKDVNEMSGHTSHLHTETRNGNLSLSIKNDSRPLYAKEQSKGSYYTDAAGAVEHSKR